MKEIQTVGVVGFGVMGAAIGLNAAAAGYRVIYKELNDDLVAAMFARWVQKPLQKRVDRGKLDTKQMVEIIGRIDGTSRYEDLGECDLVIEAAVEKMDLKIEVFEALSAACRPDAILASNTSTFLIEKLMQRVEHPERSAGLHYFFPANVNRLVEVIRQRHTSDETYAALMSFAERNGKVAISVKDFPGFAINPIFIAAYLVLDSFFGPETNAATLEEVSKEALGVRFGIMWVQNASGLGTCYHAGKSMHDYLGAGDMGYPSVPDVIKTRFESNQPWDLEDGPATTDPNLRRTVSERLLGAVFAASAHLVDREVVSVADLELGIRTALAWPRGPFTMMNELGMEESARLISLAVDAGYFALPAHFAGELPEPWKI